jgi:diacylglycerol kinase family enzyme
MTRGALVVNPSKLPDGGSLRQVAASAFADAGWDAPRYYESSPDDAGAAATRRAVEDGAELVIACGGDGTVAATASVLLNTGVPLGIVALGTGNLLARNLRLPLDLKGAFDRALRGTDRLLDVGRINGKPFVVMAGMGFDAVMLTDASDVLKARLGWPAYVVAAVRHLRDRPITAELRVDDSPAIRRRLNGLIVGNVGRLQAGLPLLPDAEPDDGLLDVALLAPIGVHGWLRVLWAVATHRRNSRRLERFAVKTLHVKTTKPMPCERDGEVVEPCDELDIEVVPGALRVRCGQHAAPTQ